MGSRVSLYSQLAQLPFCKPKVGYIGVLRAGHCGGRAPPEMKKRGVYGRKTSWDKVKGRKDGKSGRKKWSS